ncbi:MAG: hypothetical protein IJW01_01800 [Paludibacteraceae bacterium]|nr:hypothetical protein [Paludibacteraceae bacterium]
MRAIQRLDKLYFDNDKEQIKHCLNAFLQAVEYRLANKETEEAVLREIASDTPISATLYSLYSQTLRKAIDDVFEPGNELADRLRANVTRFSAYKAYHATQTARHNKNPKRVLQQFNRYLAAEYNTATIRAHRAADWQHFEQERDVLPNLEWMPSTSINPGEDHRTFWGTTLPIDDPFWEQHQPGDRWNCKCHLRNTDKEPTDRPTSDNPCDLRHDGLEGNPAHTGEVFTDNCAYVKNSGQNRKERDKVEEKCEITAQKVIRKTAKQSPLLQQSYPCEIDGEIREVRFADWGISETAYSMTGRKNLYWIKNEVLNNPEKYFKNAKYISEAEVDLSHNRGKVLRLKKKFKKYYYSEITLANGIEAFLNIILHEDGNYYLYTISKNITSYD